MGGRISGLVSWGVRDCVEKDYYGVFTKVSAYVGSAYTQIDDTNLSTFNGRPTARPTCSSGTPPPRPATRTQLLGHPRLLVQVERRQPGPPDGPRPGRLTET
ncbi:hypothetical protein ABT373_37320 [Streptomyces sp. NPDC000070]|uniref:hypothetical protein n=1 Tax=Streptomyces sp. NPDC000070 TaxID=3154240 RepID=UPI00333443DD